MVNIDSARFLPPSSGHSAVSRRAAAFINLSLLILVEIRIIGKMHGLPELEHTCHSYSRILIKSAFSHVHGTEASQSWASNSVAASVDILACN